MKLILSIDGGGIRGLLPAIVLSHLQEQVNDQIDDGGGKPLVECFDLIAGTSTGALIAMGLTRGTGPVDFKTITEIYTEWGPRIFKRRAWRRGIFEERYDAGPLETALQEVFGNELFGACTRKTLITSYDLSTRQPVVFKSWKEEHGELKLRDIGRGTSAAPHYFEPMGPISIEGLDRGLIDGGVFANNPAMCAYTEAKRIWPDESEFVVVSLGTGQNTRPIDVEKAKRWGSIEWALPMLDILFDASASAVDYHLKQLIGSRYLRLQPKLTFVNDDLDDASADNLKDLKILATQVVHENGAWLGKVKTAIAQRES